MRIKARFSGIVKSLEGDTILTFTVPENEITKEWISLSIEDILTLEAKKYNGRRSLNANAYAWKLFSEMAQVLGTDKDSIYRLQLARYGVFQDLIIKRDAIDTLKKSFRYLEIFDDGYVDNESPYVTVRCYLGSSKYDTKEMAFLIDGTVRDCKDIGIETWSREEIDRLLEAWQPI